MATHAAQCLINNASEGEYVSERDCDCGARIADLEAAIRNMQRSVPGGTHCDPQEIADTLREIAENVGVKIND